MSEILMCYSADEPHSHTRPFALRAKPTTFHTLSMGPTTDLSLQPQGPFEINQIQKGKYYLIQLI